MDNSQAGSRILKAGMYLVPVLFLLFAFNVYNDVKNYKRSRGWPIAKGVITRSWNDCSRNSKGGCRIYVEYVYDKYHARTEINDNSFFGVGWAGANALSQKYPEGLPVTVRYNPDEPRRSRLDGPEPKDWRMGVFFLAVAGCAGCLLIVDGCSAAKNE
ncbi:MAG: DUF3592 domain-containing protein [Elusimicrobia bacterium]|nr:DUF3592 domain-containing protein [Elusimicrobiota bacterium]